MIKKRFVSPLIATILLIVVSVILVTVVLTWGSDFAKDKLSIAQNSAIQNTDFTGLITTNHIENTNHLLVTNNHKSKTLKLIGYKVLVSSNSELLEYFNNKIYLFDTEIEIAPKRAEIIVLLENLPERNITISFLTDSNYFVSANIIYNNPLIYLDSIVIDYSKKVSLDNGYITSIYNLDKEIKYLKDNNIWDNLVLYLNAREGVKVSETDPNKILKLYDISKFSNDAIQIEETKQPLWNQNDMDFDGSNDYMDFFASDLTTTATIEMFCKIKTNYSAKMFFGWLRYDVWTNSGTIGYNTYASDIYGISQPTVTSLGIVNNWAHYVFEMRSDVPYTNNKIYINSQEQVLSQQFTSESPSARYFNNGLGRISGSRYSNSSYFMPMNCVYFRVYNRALTQDEITNNYNYTISNHLN
jgi:hypothetical protein